MSTDEIYTFDNLAIRKAGKKYMLCNRWNKTKKVLTDIIRITNGTEVINGKETITLELDPKKNYDLYCYLTQLDGFLEQCKWNGQIQTKFQMSPSFIDAIEHNKYISCVKDYKLKCQVRNTIFNPSHLEVIGNYCKCEIMIDYIWVFGTAYGCGIQIKSIVKQETINN